MAKVEPPKDVARRIYDWIWTLDALVFVVHVVAAIFVGLFVVGTWIVRLWVAQSWWHLFLLAGTSLFLLAGFAMEMRARRVGPFGIVVVVLALVFGAQYLYEKVV